MNLETLGILIVGSVAVLVVLTLVVCTMLVIRDTVRRRGNWGINLKQVVCPECGEPAPAVRTPANSRQALWGGSTCRRCGVEYDKWGRAIDDCDDSRDR